GGSFMMGSEDGGSDEKPVHKVTLSPFYMAETEVTVAQFKAFIDDTGYKTDADKDGESYIWTGSAWDRKSGVNWRCDVKGDKRPASDFDHPVIHVSWHDAAAYTQWVSQQTGDKYRLPTEAEWEYAAGAGASNRTKYAGTNSSTIDAYAVHWGNSNQQTAPVKSKRPNTIGLYDMSGNVWEWCQDRYGIYPSSSQTNPTGPTSGDYRVMRGGSWFNDPQFCRVAFRFSYSPSRRLSYVGFRLSQHP
ncbi:MAG: formylglycine-generating enzyme family protein, partial [Bacteroidota bacterium]